MCVVMQAYRLGARCERYGVVVDELSLSKELSKSARRGQARGSVRLDFVDIRLDSFNVDARC
jgi:hypothetical protein